MEKILSLFEVIENNPSCSSYNSLWGSKIKEEFRMSCVPSTSLFEEYKFLRRFYKCKIYNVIYVDRYPEEDYDADSWVQSFADRESAISFIIQAKVREAVKETGQKDDINKEIYPRISKEVIKLFEIESFIPYNYGYLYINVNRINKYHPNNPVYKV